LHGDHERKQDMRIYHTIRICTVWLIVTAPLYGQGSPNCFLEDFELKNATLPPYIDVAKTTATPTVIATMNAADTLGRVSKYVLGNALAVWIGNTLDTPPGVLTGHLQKLSPTLIRYPGGSWSDIFFWSSSAPDLPDSVVDGTNSKKYRFTPQFGTNSWPTTLDNYCSGSEHSGQMEGGN
jgi:hypothetical protein